MAEFQAVKWHKDNQVRSFYFGSKTTELGRAAVNIMKTSDGKWHLTGFRVSITQANAYRDDSGEVRSDTAHKPHDLGWSDTFRDAKWEAEFWINNTVCMKSLDDEILVDAI